MAIRFRVLVFLAFAAVSEGTYRIKPTQHRDPQYVWTAHGPDQVGLYRIPLLATAPNGDLIAITEGRKDGGADAGYKFLSQRSISSKSALGLEGAPKWSPTVEELDNGYTTRDGAILGAIVTDYVTGTMFVVYGECFHECPTSRTFVMNSTNSGRSWSEPVDISPQVGSDRVAFAAGPGTGIQKMYPPHKGRLVVCGHYHDVVVGQSLMLTEGFKCIYSDDHGHSWKNGSVIPGLPYNETKREGDFLPNECQPVELPDGSILISIRNQYRFHGAARMFASSVDGGETIRYETFRVAGDLPDAACAAGMVYVPEYDVLLHSNIISTNRRANITLSWSYDRGKTWDAANRLVIWPEGAAYSCMTVIPSEGRPSRYVGVLYEQGETSKADYGYITFVVFDLNPEKID